MLGKRPFGQEDAFVEKIDPSTGEVVWAAQVGSAQSEVATALAFDTAGNGVPVGAWQRGSSADDLVAGVAVDPCGRVFVAGTTFGDLVPGQPNQGGRDMFLVKVDL